MSIDVDHDTEVMQISDEARSHVIGVRAGEINADELALWIEVSGVLDGSYVYDMYFQPRNDAGNDHHIYDDGELTIIIPRNDVSKLLGAQLRLSGDADGSMEISNPNKPLVATPAMDLSDLDRDSDLAKLVQSILDEQVNPAIASHGGGAQLVGIKDDVAYVNLSGGCQGCSMSRVTLANGIETSIKEAVPQIKAVVDVTDHASGSNPYFN